MEYYPLQDVTTGQYWKLKVTNGILCLEENTQSESNPNPIINDKDGTTWILYVDNGCIALTDTTTQPATQFYLYDPTGDTWRVIADHGVIGIEKVYGKAQLVLKLSYHPLDCRSGRWVDLSRKGNHGTPYGGARPYMIAPGVMGYWFNGMDGYILIPDNDSLDNTIVFVAWINPRMERTATIGYHIVISKHADYRHGLYMDYATQPNRIVAIFYSGTSTSAAGYTVPAYNDWYYAVAMFKDNRANLYINGEIQAQGGAIATHSGDNTEPVRIGGGISNRYTYGIIAEPLMDNQVWSEAEVRENMYRSPIYRMLRGLPHSQVYIKVPWKQTQGGIYVP